MIAANHTEHHPLRSVGLCTVSFATVTSIFLCDRQTVDYFHDMAVELPPDLIALLGFLGEPTLYVVVGSLVLSFCGIAYVNTGFSFSEFRIPSRASFILLAATGPWLLAEILQICFGRTPPHLYLGGGIYAFHPFKIGANFSSFPSEQAAVAAAMAAAFSTLVPTYRFTFSLLAVAIAGSGLAAGLHYPSDIVAGMLLGTVVVAWLEAMFDRFALHVRVERPRLRR